MRGRIRRWRPGKRNCAPRSRKRRSICRFISSPSNRARRSRRCSRRQAHAARPRSWRRAFFDVTQEVCADAGLPAYEVSNHARAGAQCRHNLLYWRYRRVCGHRSRRPWQDRALMAARHATATEPRPEDWLERVESAGHGIIVDEMLSRARDGRRVFADGPAAHGRHRSWSLSRARADVHSTMRVAALPVTASSIGQDGRVHVTRAGFPVLDAVVARARRLGWIN